MNKAELQKLLREELPLPGFQATLSRTYPAAESGADRDEVVTATVTAVGDDRFLFSLGENRGSFLVRSGEVVVEPEHQPLWETFLEEIRDMVPEEGRVEA